MSIEPFREVSHRALLRKWPQENHAAANLYRASRGMKAQETSFGG